MGQNKKRGETKKRWKGKKTEIEGGKMGKGWRDKKLKRKNVKDAR